MLTIIAKGNRQRDVQIIIRQIDKDRNGYITSSELDDILKHHYPKELQNKDLMTFM